MPTDSSQTFPLSGQHDSSESDGQDRDVAGAAQDRAQQAAGQAQEKAQQAAGQVQDRLREQIDQRSEQAAEQIKTQASDLQAVSDALRKEGKDRPAQAAARLAGYAEKIGGYLHEKDSHALLADAEDFGRQRPWAAAAGGLAIGLAASRFLKASSGRRYETRNTKPDRNQVDAGSPADHREIGPLELGYGGASALPTHPPADQSGLGSVV